MTKQGIKKIEKLIKSFSYNESNLKYYDFCRVTIKELRNLNLKILKPTIYDFEIRNIDDFNCEPQKFEHNQLDDIELLLKKLKIRYDIKDKTIIIYNNP